MTKLDNTNFCVYAVQNLQTKNIKIGITKNIKNRMQTLQTGSDADLCLIGRVGCEDSLSAQVLEADIHDHLSGYHVRGEWFTNACLDLLSNFGFDVYEPCLLSIDTAKCRQAKLTGAEYNLLLLLTEYTAECGLVDLTQCAAAEILGTSQPRVSINLSSLKAKGLLLKDRSKGGRIKYRINPEFCWNYSLDIRKNMVTDIRQAKLERGMRQAS